MRDLLRPYYSPFRPVYLPILRSIGALAYGHGDTDKWQAQSKLVPGSQAGTAIQPPFDTFLMHAKPEARLSAFRPRYPFALDRGPEAECFYARDPNARFGHEPELAHLIDLLVPDNGVFLDIGSNFGYFSIFLGSRSNFRGRIHAFEPIASSFAGLRDLVNSLRCDDVVTCHCVAVSDRVGTAKMDSGTDPGLAAIKGDDFEDGETVQTVTLDSLNLDRVDFIKIDVEGHEANALRGAEALIKSNDPYIFLESWTFPEQPDKVFEPLRFLLDRAYQLYLPAWAQSNGTFFVGIGPSHEMGKLALVPFSLKDRLTFPGNPINIFASPSSGVARLGSRWHDILQRQKS